MGMVFAVGTLFVLIMIGYKNQTKDGITMKLLSIVIDILSRNTDSFDGQLDELAN